MKKFFITAALFGAAFFAANLQASAQTKMGYFDLETMVSYMPGIAKVDTALQMFERDSIGPEYEFEMSEFQRQDSILRKDSAVMPARVYQQRQQEQARRLIKLQNWQQYAQQLLQAKQQELLYPYYEKVGDAFRAVVKEGKYTYVFKQEVLFEAPPGDNLIFPVAKKLGVTLPKELTDPPAAK